MSVASSFRSEVASPIRSRGEQYYRDGRVVKISFDLDEGLISATVKGSDAYEVNIWVDGNEAVDFECDCPYFQDNFEPCKHIWAAALAADAAGGAYNLPVEGKVHPMYSRSKGLNKKARSAAPRPQPPAWKKQLAAIRNQTNQRDYEPQCARRKEQQYFYVVNANASRQGGQCLLQLLRSERKLNGEWGKTKAVRPDGILLSDITDLTDREIIATLKGASNPYNSGSYGYGYHYYSYYTAEGGIPFPFELAKLLLPRICATGRLRLKSGAAFPDELPKLPVQWDSGPAWKLSLRITRDQRQQQYILAGSLSRDQQRIPLSQPDLLVAGGLVFDQGFVSLLDDGGAFEWINLLRTHCEIRVPFAQVDELLAEMFGLPKLPPLELPPELCVEEVTVTPRPRLLIRSPKKSSSWGYGYEDKRLRAELSFDYDGAIVPEDQESAAIYQPERRRLIRRSDSAEAASIDRLQQLGIKKNNAYYEREDAYRFDQAKLAKVVRSLSSEGWYIEAQGKLYRQPGKIDIQVTSGIDWFDLNAEVDFGGKKAKLPALLEALRKGQDTVVLDDGTLGVLPEDWLRKYGFIAGAGEQQDGHVRFRRNQAGLLDALLASQPEARWDEAFDRTRQELRRFEGVVPKDPPAEFRGELRPYQRDGLGWFDFLERFGFGGCLADDMGLGKTVQVLALLEARRGGSNGNGSHHAPSLVVVPRSLVFNWKSEAARFAPNLRVLDHSGIGRERKAGHLANYDVILTTYGTLRRDIAYLKDVAFDYAVLDEAQAIKNPNSESAKAARLINSTHRLALSGTPVQNHLGDLWSLFDFLNPGMLGSASVFASASSVLRNPDDETRQILARAVRPFILRRTKEQVAKDLPSRLEQTIYCDLDTKQRKLYNELRDHYRMSLLKTVDALGINRSKIQILEALLRLRQAAIHPGLIDKARTGEDSAKLDMLLAQLEEVVQEGHKALVFSQFTSMLSILGNRLDKDKIEYEYLDGKTKDRQKRVDHFQTDEGCKLFLISLKAGGLGLNLTAADYVFLLDPWWNPAIEQQAIDRTHRIGQTRQVYACRLIAKDTVEEKVLALQEKKRDLADAIITADNSLIRTLGREDLELLLS